MLINSIAILIGAIAVATITCLLTRRVINLENKVNAMLDEEEYIPYDD